ncbi:MAG: hypothetical protein HC897_08280 [Thermoanaerobaculia bacterium]|nr:hypothetical protein [Thermoanaerobaculia bacterium]
MKLGDVIKKERDKKGLSVEDTAARLSLSVDEYQKLEAGESAAEVWGPHLAHIAIELETPTSRLLAESGRSADCKPGQAGTLIKGHRERRQKTIEQMAQALEISKEEYEQVEQGSSPIEQVGPQMLAFAEAIEQPVFNLFYPCGLPFQELDDYP